MPSSTRWPDAALAGLASSMRTFATPALLAVRGRVPGKARVALLTLAVGELATDKTSAATDRTDLPALAGRTVAGAASGRMIAGPSGVAAGAVGAAVGTFASFRIRKLVVAATGLPDPVVAVGEDIVAFGVAALATSQLDSDAEREAPAEGGDADAPAPERSKLRDALDGLAAGAIGTTAMTLAQGAEFALTDAEPSTSPAQVLDKAKRSAGLGKLSKKHYPAANQGMHWLYGTMWGAPYGLVAGSVDAPPELTGPLFGVLVYGAAIAQYPLLGLAPVPWKRSLQSLGSELLFHLVYGVGVGAGWRALHQRGGR